MGNVSYALPGGLEPCKPDAEKSTDQACKVFILHGDSWRSKIPEDVTYVSLKMGDYEAQVKDTRDLLIWVCKFCALKNYAAFNKYVSKHSVKWLMPHKYGMTDPYQLSTHWYLDLGGIDKTRLLRVSLILSWTWHGPAPKLRCLKKDTRAVGDALPIEIPPGHTKKPAPITETDKNVTLFSYKNNNVSTLNGKEEPIALIFDGKEYLLDGEWSNLPEKICLALETLCPGMIRYWVKQGRVSNMALGPRGFRKGKFVKGVDIWYETDCDLREFIRQTRKLCQCLGVGLERISIKYIDKGSDKKKPNPGVSEPNFPSDLPHTICFQRDIAEHYPDGFDFKSTSKRLVELRVMKNFSEDVEAWLKGLMFECVDGTWLFPDAVMSEEIRERAVTKAKEWISGGGLFAIEAFRKEFESDERKKLGHQDYERFFVKYIAEKIHCRARGPKSCKVCVAKEIEDETAWCTVAAPVRRKLSDHGDAMSIEELLIDNQHLSKAAILHLGERVIEDVVFFEADGIEYLKLLEAYYLPNDFSVSLLEIVKETECEGGAASVVLLESGLNNRYGDNFRVNYGLEDDAVFKQVIEKSFDNKAYNWNRDVFVSSERHSGANVAEVFLQNRNEMFHEEEFFDFALSSRGFQNRGMLILTFLRRHCIRMSKEWWISCDGFDNKFGLSDEQYYQIGESLNDAVGNHKFLPINELAPSVYEKLPRLVSGDKEYPWNPYLLTSVAVHRVNNAKVDNDEPSPYTVTAIILPRGVSEVNDIVTYVLNSFPDGYFADADVAFNYLKEHQIRLTKTRKLMLKIHEALGIN